MADKQPFESTFLGVELQYETISVHDCASVEVLFTNEVEKSRGEQGDAAFASTF